MRLTNTKSKQLEKISKIEKTSEEVGLEVNKDKTNLIDSTSRVSRRLDQSVNTRIRRKQKQQRQPKDKHRIVLAKRCFLSAELTLPR